MAKDDHIVHKSGGHSVQNKFRLDKQNAKLMGVSGGIANYFGWDVNLIRIAFVLAALFGVGTPVLIYLAIGLIAD